MAKEKSAPRPPTIAEVIRATIEARGLTAYAVAKLSGVSVDPIARFMKGERDIRLGTAEKIATALGLILVDRPE